MVNLRAGDIVTRSDLVIEYGGSVQSGGIVPSTTSNTVFVFTDPTEGTQFGYVYDGFSVDGSVLHYTGAGRDGDQKTSGSNSPILTHAQKGRTLHAFSAAGVLTGTSTKLQRYIGEFVLDPSHPYDRMPAPDRNGKTRTVLVFRLLPVRPIPDEVVTAVGVSEITDSVRSLEVPVELNSVEYFERIGTTDQVATRRESNLVTRYVATRPSHVFKRWAISLPAERTTLLTDVYDRNERTLFEAKAITSRSDVRMAIGQLLDYRRHVDVPDLKCAVLLPSRPTADLRDLIWSSGFGLTYETATGFETAAA